MRSFWFSGAIAPAVLLVGMATASGLRDIGVDSLSTHQDPVVALLCGWNPLKDPYFGEAESLAVDGVFLRERVFGQVQRGSTVSFTYVLASVAASVWGHHEAGKGISFVFGWMMFSFAMVFGGRLSLLVRWRIPFALAVASNPVWIYQSLSFYQDGTLSVVFSCVILQGALTVLGRVSLWSGLSVCSMLVWILSGLKIAGLGYAGLSLGLIGLGVWVARRAGLTRIIPWAVISIAVVIVGGDISRYWSLSSKLGLQLYGKVESFAEDEVVEGGGGFGQIEGFASKSKLFQFVASNFSRTHPSPREVEWKLPFTIDREELKVFGNVMAEPRAGGFGPLYSGMLLLGLGLLVCLVRDWPGMRIFGVVMVLTVIPLAFVPVYWARWIGHIWMLPLIAVVCILRRDGDGIRVIPEGVPVLSLVPGLVFGKRLATALLGVACLNGILIASSYFVGVRNVNRIIDRQIAMILTLEQPVTAYIGWSRACRFWLMDVGIDFRRDYLPDSPFVRLYRTEARVFFPAEKLDAPVENGGAVRTVLLDLRAWSAATQPGQFYSEIFWEPEAR